MSSVDTIHLEADGRGSFTFTFSSARGEFSGRVNVGPKVLRTGGRPQTKIRRLKTKFWLWRENWLRSANRDRRQKRWKSIMTSGYGNASFAIKIGYFVFATAVVVFVSMLILTML
jgi:hypothetical protein